VKTFEAEMHDIQHGATHYRNECREYDFSWVKYIGGEMLVWDDCEWYEIVDNYFEKDVKKIK
jgi:hypothetical protein